MGWLHFQRHRLFARATALLFALTASMLCGPAYAGTEYCFVNLELSAERSTYGQTIGGTITLIPESGASGADMGTGTMTIRVRDGQTLATTTLTSNGANFSGAASFEGLAPGTYRIEAEYTGDDVLIACSTMLSEDFNDLRISKAASRSTISQSSSKSDIGESVTFTANVGSDNGGSVASPGGEVVFYIDGKRFARKQISGSRALLTTSKLTPGTHTVSTRYAGDGNYKGGESDTITHTVAGEEGSIRLLPNAAPAGEVGKAYALQFRAKGGTAPYRLSMVRGSLPKGLVFSSSNGRVHGTPRESGSFPITVRAIDSNDLRDRVSVIIEIRDGAGSTLEAFEGERRSARRLGEAQIDAILDRLHALHGRDCLPSSIEMTAGEAAISKDNASADGICTEDTAVWLSGTYISGERSAYGQQPFLDYGTSGFTAGMDRRISSDMVLGASVGMGFDHTDIGTEGSTSDGRALSAAVYGSWEFTEKTYIDALFGYNRLTFDGKRYSEAAARPALYERDGNQVFGALSLSTELAAGEVRISPFSRMKFTATRLERARENGAGDANLTYLASDDFTTTASAGVEIDRTFAVAFGSVRPFLGLEFQREITGDAVQEVFLTRMPESRAEAVLDTVSNNLFSARFGTELEFAPSLNLVLTYSAATDFDNNWMQAGVARLSTRF